MKKSIAILYLLCCCYITHPQKLLAQTGLLYNINLYNGLPSNRIYNITVDHFGYLWICTDGGLFRYNGYTLEEYSLPEGLPNKDIWGLTPDIKGRLWIHAISNKCGYIYNNKYHDVYVAGKEKPALYFTQIYSDNAGIYAISKAAENDILYAERNDTLKPVNFFKDCKGGVLNGNRELISIDPKRFFYYDVDPMFQTRLKSVVENRLPLPSVNSTYSIWERWVICKANDRSCISAQNLLTDEVKTIGFRDQAGKSDKIIDVHYTAGGTLQLITKNEIYLLDKDLNITDTILIGKIMPQKYLANADVLYAINTNLWDMLIPTKSQGLFLSYNTENAFQLSHDIDITGYTCISKKVTPATSYWWNQYKRTIMIIDTATRHIIYQKNALNEVQILLPIDNTYSIIQAQHCFYKIAHPSNNISSTPIPVLDTNGVPRDIFVRMGVSVAEKKLYFTGTNFWQSEITDTGIVFKEIINSNKYFRHIDYDTLRKALWLYDSDGALLYSLKGEKVLFECDAFKQYGISGIEKIISDPASGCVYLKDNEHLYKIDLKNRQIQSLYSNYNLKNCLFYIADNKLVLAGKFGVLFGKTDAPDKFIVYPNIKNSLYNKAEDAAILINKLQLKTDKGLYSIRIPDDVALATATPPIIPYKFILRYRDTLFDATTQYRLQIVQTENLLGIDVINPQGNGKLTVSYFIEGVSTKWNELNGSELLLPQLTPDDTYRLYLKASDDVWNSNVSMVILDIAPFWWQTPVCKWCKKPGLY